jgi:hypothetical protein
MLARCGESNAVLPPTELFNEGWMLRLILDWAAHHPSSIEALRFGQGSTWYSEALLASRFKPRRRGDTSGEGFTHADAVIGHFQLRPEGGGEIELLPGARQITVVEAKMASGLSAGTKHAPDFNQAARNVACIAHLIDSSGVSLESLRHCGFVVVAPKARITDGVFDSVAPEAIDRTVKTRAESFDASAADWFERVFRPVMARCAVTVLAWETALEEISLADPSAGRGLDQFYEQCLRFNPLSRSKVAN